ncbi:replication protein A 14 kDa subunit B-like [Corylus avellana]|uniref:replication protein A 14 kDa subunit B-like n=1 Tax=Corylus avellana TaxID=13451 RepID=UPI00286C420A|nr:replication protein A 14 kDa subunit B-like [Corylus avellana]XP_059443350.1 replication protein A 14 kDa subunit B-like [Corylus avellana]
MDTSSPTVFVNPELLPMYVGRKVRAVVQVTQSDGEIKTGKSTDERQLIIKGLPQVPLMTHVGVIGIAESEQSLHAETWTNFGNTFDTQSYNQVCQLANGEFKGLFL